MFSSLSTSQLGPVRDYVKMLCQNEGLKFLVFAHHHVMLNAVAEQLHEDKATYIRIDGNTPQHDRPVWGWGVALICSFTHVIEMK